MKRKSSKGSKASKARRTSSSKVIVNRTKRKQIKQKIRKSRPLPKRVLFHPVTVFILLCIGVLIIGWTYKVVADFYSVTAEVAAPPLTQAATITQPTDGYISSTELITVSGFCPTNSYVNLYDNSVFSGVAWCLSDNTYSIQLDLYLGQNTLTVQDYNVTNSPGPPTPSITVTYQPPVASIVSGSGSAKKATTSITQSYPPLLLQSSFHFQTFLERQQFSWKVSVSGGKPPFIINVTWGDEQTTAYSISGDQSFDITHVYYKGGYYPILVTAVDSAGNQKVLQLAALIRYPGQNGFAFPTSNQSPPASTKGSGFSFGKLFGSNKWLLIAWPTYLVILLMATSFWLGERQEYNRLARSRR